MVVSIKSAAPADYYFQTAAMELSPTFGRGVWYGSLGLGVDPGAAVHGNELANLLRSQGARSGKPVRGSDFVFSVPKSVSLLWAFSGELKDCIEGAHIGATLEATKFLFSEAIRERCGKGGIRLNQAKTVAAVFLHVATRFASHIGGDTFPDPNLHCHVIVPDLCIGALETLKVPYTALYRHWSMALGAWYHAHLAYNLGCLGIPLEPEGENGLFQIKGIDRRHCIAFSGRTRGAILGHIEVGTFERALRVSREPYRAITGADLNAKWERHRRLVGFDPGRIVGYIAKASRPVTDASLPSAFFEDVVKLATEHEALVQRQHLARALSSELVRSQLRKPPSTELLEELIDSGLLTDAPATASYGLQRWTSFANKEHEEELSELAQVLAQAAFPVAQIDERSIENFTEEQVAAARRATGGEGRLILIEGAPGTGKTFLLSPVVNAYRQEHGQLSVIGAAESWQAALALKTQFKIESYALSALFVRLKSHPRTLDEKSVLIVDEAGLLSTKRMLELLRIARKKRSRLLLLGDQQQLSPIGAGSGLALVRPHVHPIRLTQVRRQQGGHRDVVDALIQGDVGRLAHLIADREAWLSCANSEAAVAAVVAAVTSQDSAANLELDAQKLVIVRSNRELHHVTRRLRAVLRGCGRLSGEDFSVNGVTPMGHGVRFQLAVGDVVKFLVRADKYGVYNGTRAIIRSLQFGPKGLKFEADICLDSVGSRQGQRIEFLDKDFMDDKARLRLAPAYASTVYGCQGETVEQSVILKSATMSLREFYVAVTRARSGVKIIDVNSARARLQTMGSEGRPLLQQAIFRDLKTMYRNNATKTNFADVAVEPRTARKEWNWDVVFDLSDLQKSRSPAHDIRSHEVGGKEWLTRGSWSLPALRRQSV